MWTAPSPFFRKQGLPLFRQHALVTCVARVEGVEGGRLHPSTDELASNVSQGDDFDPLRFCKKFNGVFPFVNGYFVAKLFWEFTM